MKKGGVKVNLFWRKNPAEPKGLGAKKNSEENS